MDLYETVKKRNTVAFLGSNFNRQFISLCLIDYYAYKLREGLVTWSVILVSNENKVASEARVFQNLSDLRIGNFETESSNQLEDKNLVHAFWTEKVRSNQVLVMSCSLFAFLLSSSIVSVSQINLIVMYEAHLVLVDESYKKVAQYIRSSNSEETRLLAFCPSIISSKRTPEELEIVLSAIENLLQASREALTDMRLSFRATIEPACELIKYTDRSVPFLISDKSCVTLSRSLIHVIQKNHDLFDSDSFTTAAHLISCICDLTRIKNSLGPWCAKEFAEICITELNEGMFSKSVIGTPLCNILSATISLFQHFANTLREKLVEHSESHQLKYLVNEKMQIIHKILSQYSFSQSKEGCQTQPPLSGVIFIDDRVTVRLLHNWLRKLISTHEKYSFLNIDYLIVDNRDPIGEGKQNTKKEDTLLKFRRHNINLLIASSVLEEQLDIPRCNMVMRYDVPENFVSFLNSKKRVRLEGGKFILLMPKDNDELEQRLSRFVTIEHMLKDSDPLAESTLESEKELSSTSYPPYNTPTGAQVSLMNSLQLLNRYCLRLPSDTFTKLTPLYELHESEDQNFYYEVRLPTNSPVREPIRGCPATSKIIAQKSAALEACKILHSRGELNDNLLPVGKESNKYIEELGIKTYPRNKQINSSGSVQQDRPGTTKRRQYYHKRVAEVLRGPPPRSDSQMNLFIILMKLDCSIPEEQNIRGRKLIDPMDSSRFLGILTRKMIPITCDFPVYTRSGEVTVHAHHIQQNLSLSDSQLSKIRDFHFTVFNDVLHLIREPMRYDPDEADTSFFVLPLSYNKDCDDLSKNVSIDWTFIDKVSNYENERKGNRIQDVSGEKKFTFERSLFEDAVVKPNYRPADDQHHFYVAAICDHLNPLSPFPNKAHGTFLNYYKTKYDVTISDLKQPLLDVDHTSARLNLLTPRYVNRKGMTLPMSSQKTRESMRENLGEKQILIPELCIVHPFPASFWNKVVCLPSILYRMNHLLLAEELREKVAKGIGIGILNPPSDFKWPPLDFGWTLMDALSNPIEDNSNNSENEPSSSFPSSPATKSKSKNSSKSNSNWKKESKPSEVPTNLDDLQDGLVIDTFDPSKYQISDSILNGSPWHNMSSGDQTNKPSIDHWLMPDENVDILPGPIFVNQVPKVPKTDQETPRVHKESPQNTDGPDSEPSKKEREWKAERLPTTTLDLGIPGLSCISGIEGVNLHDLSKELVDIQNFDDFEDSDDEELEDIQIDNSVFMKDQVISSDVTPTSKPVTKHPQRAVDKTTPKFELLTPPRKLKSDESHTFIDDLVPFCDEKPAVAFLDRRSSQEIISKNFKCDTVECSSPEEILPNKLEEELLLEATKVVQELEPLCSREDKANDIDRTSMTDSPIDDVDRPNFGELLPNRNAINVDDSALKNNPFFIHLDPINSEFDPQKGPSPAMILQALTMSNASDGINLERLETVGDSFLKYAVTAFMYCRCPDQHEGLLSQLRSTQISNLRLYNVGSEIKLGEVMVALKFEPNQNWLPPGFKVPKELYNFPELEDIKEGLGKKGDEIQKNDPHSLIQHTIPDKSVADCVEALIGAYLISCGQRGALMFMQWLGILVMDNSCPEMSSQSSEKTLWRWLREIRPPLLFPEKQEELDLLYKRSGLKRFEHEILGYQFRDKALLVQAFTHNSFSDNHVTDCYQRLEFLGDAVLDFLITRHLYEDSRKHSPGQLTDLRSALVNNTFFASLAVEYNFHKYLRYKTPDLYRVISKFVDYRNSSTNERFREDFPLLLGEGDCEQLEDIEVPKALGDVFESVAGAIYLDSGLSLDTVWRVYYRMMRPEMEYYTVNVPKSPIRELLESSPMNVSFSKPDSILVNGALKIQVKVDVFERETKRTYVGVGRNRRLAKCTAAKRALRDLRASQELEDHSS
ncbi:endoribonuclease Dcr-1 [Brevipalpus obovatus]|uniref:endoribonuclease Dcr-1 n=1 Tax=Brevipalpus obovatus TaxID=246614 RepID=UPI003D9E0866